MERADSKKISNPGHESHVVLLCHRCGWPFPNAHPSARYRRAHKRMCGTIEGYTDSENTTTLSHSHSQHSVVSSFSDDEHGSDGDSKAPSAKGVISTSVNEGGSGRVLERMNMSSDDVFADAVSEFVDTNASLESEEGLGITKKTTIAQDAVGIRNFSPPVEETSVTGSVPVPESANHENLKSEGPQEGSVTSLDPEKVVSFSEIPAKSETMTDANEENKRANAFEDPAGLETGFTEIDDASEVNAGVVIVPVIEESKTSEAVTEGRTNVELSVAESEISQSEETHDVKSGSEIVVDDQSQGGKTIICSSDEISEVKVDDNIPRSKGSAGTSPRISENNEVVGVPLLVTNELVDSSCEIERYISCSLSVDDIGAPPIAAVNETLETSSTLTTSGHESEETNEKYLDCLTRASANAGAGAISTTDKNGQPVLIGGSDINDPEDGFENRGTVAEAGRKVPENEMKSDNMYDDNGSEACASMLHVVSLTVTHENTDTETFDDIGTGNAERFVPKDLSLNEDASLVQSIGATSETAHNQLDSGVESLHAEGAVQVASDVNSLDDESIGNSIEISNEVKLDQAEASDPVTDPKPVSHDILLQKLEEDLSDDEPVECSLATESLSQSLGNNPADDGGVACKDAASSKDLAQSQEFDAVPEKGATVTAADVPYDISSPNGSSLDGNWGSVSVLSTMSDATAADVKKMKDAQEEQSHDKSDIFDPPSFQTLVKPQAEKETAVSSKSGEVCNPQKQTDAAKAAWFPSITNVANDSHGRKKNEEIIAKVTNWSTGKQHLPLKTLLGEAKANSPNTNTPAVPKANSPNSPGKNKTPVTTVNSILGAEESELPKDKIESSAKEWSSSARYPDEIKREKRKVKGKPYWVPFMCCSSSVK